MIVWLCAQMQLASHVCSVADPGGMEGANVLTCIRAECIIIA